MESIGILEGEVGEFSFGLEEKQNSSDAIFRLSKQNKLLLLINKN